MINKETNMALNNKEPINIKLAMTPIHYEQILTDFYTNAYLKLCMEGGVPQADKNIQKFYQGFLDNFNETLAKSFLEKMNELYPTLLLKVQNYPPKFWESSQAKELLQQSLIYNVREILSEDNPNRLKDANQTIDNLKALIALGRIDVIYQSIYDLARTPIRVLENIQNHLGNDKKYLEEIKEVFALYQEEIKTQLPNTTGEINNILKEFISMSENTLNMMQSKVSTKYAIKPSV